MMHRNQIYPFVKNCNVASFARLIVLKTQAFIYYGWLLLLNILAHSINDSGPKSFLSKIEVKKIKKAVAALFLTLNNKFCKNYSSNTPSLLPLFIKIKCVIYK